jgi:hypothetical protein
MSAENRRVIEKIFILMEECGMPDKLPSRELLWDLYFMIEEHIEFMGWYSDE